MSNTQRLVFSIIEFLNSEHEFSSLSEDGKESLEVVIECLERVYNVSSSNQSDISKFHFKEPLKDIFEKALKNESAKKSPTDQDKNEAEKLKAEGNELMKQGQHNKAINSYNKAMKYDWTNAVYLCNRAAAHSKLGEHEQAIEDCKKALELDNKYGKAYGRMGMAYMALEKYKEAKDSYTKAVELEPGNDLYKRNLAAVAEKLSQEHPSSQPTGMPGGPTLLNSLFSNPGIMNMAQQFMTNPQMQQMMTNMMGGMAGVGGGMPASQATQQPPPETTNPSGTAETTNPESTSQGTPNLFQFASQMAQQLQQTNPDLVNNLRATMQQTSADQPNADPQNPPNEEKE